MRGKTHASMQVSMTYILVNRNSPLQALCITRDEDGAVCVVPMSLRDAVRQADARGESVDIIPYEGRPESLQLLTDELGDVDLRGEDDLLHVTPALPGAGFDVFALDDERCRTPTAADPEVIDAILDGFFDEAVAGASVEHGFDVDIDIDIDDDDDDDDPDGNDAAS
jgi:hypothetical protein